ncbi:MAG TPA: threonine transporter RhtB [Oceanospirillaceae bacterium]|nr:threonine transporter RhtB [Oceanospirillaceae bacterium]
METAAIIAFATTFFFVSITPGMCMTLALTLGMTVGLRRTMWMMVGELVGVGSIAVLSMVGVAALVLKYPSAFIILKVGGGAYLAYLGVQLWRSRGKMAIDLSGAAKYTGRWELISQGFLTAIANPKGWAFCIALLPPFINMQQPFVPQVVIIVAVISFTEFISMVGYALGGKSLGKLLMKGNNVRVMNRIAGTLMLAVALWLAMG